MSSRAAAAGATTIAIRGVRPRRRRWLLATLAPLLAIGVVGLVAIDMAGAPTRTGSAGPAGAAIAAVEVPRPAVSPIAARTDAPASEQTPRLIETPVSAAPGLTRLAASSQPAVEEVLSIQPAERGDTAPAPGTHTVRSGWVCDGAVQLVDPRHRRWSLGRVTFRAGAGFERVILHLDRLGPHSGGIPTVTAEALATSKVRGLVPGASRPTAGSTTVSLSLTDALETNLGLRGYRPRGLRVLKEFSVYRRARGITTVLVSAAGDGCIRLSTPEWTERGPNAKQARIVLDVRA